MQVKAGAGSHAASALHSSSTPPPIRLTASLSLQRPQARAHPRTHTHALVKRARIALVGLVEAVGGPKQHVQSCIVGAILRRQGSTQGIGAAAAGVGLFCQGPAAHQPALVWSVVWLV